MNLTPEEVEKIAKLARIKLSDEEKEMYAGELTAVLDYADQLSEVDTTDVEPVAHVTGVAVELAEDRVEEYEDKQALIDAAPDHTENQIKTKKIL